MTCGLIIKVDLPHLRKEIIKKLNQTGGVCIVWCWKFMMWWKLIDVKAVKIEVLWYPLSVLDRHASVASIIGTCSTTLLGGTCHGWKTRIQWSGSLGRICS